MLLLRKKQRSDPDCPAGSCVWRGQQVRPVEGEGRKAGKEDRVKALCVVSGMGTLPGGRRCHRGCGVHPGMGMCRSRCDPFGETYSKAPCYSSWRKMCDCFIRITAGAWAMAGTMALLELPGWGPPGWRRSSEQVPEHEPRGPGGREAWTHVLVRSRMKFPRVSPPLS